MLHIKRHFNWIGVSETYWDLGLNQSGKIHDEYTAKNGLESFEIVAL
jgi:hypothetical protein